MPGDQATSAEALEPLAETLSNPVWQDRAQTLRRALKTKRIIESKLTQPQRALMPCACGCAEPVASGRMFVDREHQRRWLKDGGGSVLGHLRWRSIKH